jgi:hypothetical protein
VITAERYAPTDSWETKPAEFEPMLATLRVELRGTPKDARFLHVIQGASAGANADAASLIQSSGGAPFAGAVVKGAAVLFPVSLGAVAEVKYAAPAGVTRHLVTGLKPGAGYEVARQPAGGGEQITVKPGSAMKADEGGVLAF